ncbi:GNAT family N-acetyltransferase [Cohnella zeiphila]|uniref:GNAT family N-acetyltransferase n=1 Tax=Cohnella zeiphila TaxID=2761120 RepID=A0A7X0SPN3_9BACL|nr:GNAT family N-acetyltransferase [Cohnella zeiphila]MBB6733857.1 GNAT family N-acetyltransferase [Cohnella zeiphila]
MDTIPFDEIYAIMKASFPDSETRTYEGQRELLGNPHYRILAEKNGDGKTIAFLAAWEFPSMRFVEHLAVDPAVRSGGIGRALMADYMGQSPLPIVLEVEPPVTELARRRVGFYERLGFHLNPYGYVQPPLREGRREMPLRLMSYPHPLAEEEFERCKRKLYTEVYRVPSA